MSYNYNSQNPYEPNYAPVGSNVNSHGGSDGNAGGFKSSAEGFFSTLRNTFEVGVRSVQEMTKSGNFAMERECLRAAEILKEFVVPPKIGDLDSIIPPDVLKRCKGIAVINVLKGAFLWGGRLGSGVVIARLPDGSWSGPSAIKLGGASIGGQIGGSITQVVMILNTQEAVETFYKTGNFNLGSSLSMAAGPVGRSGELAASFNGDSVAAVYSYSRTKGAFIGVSVEGSVIIYHRDVNYEFYGQNAPPKDVLTGVIRPRDDIPEWNELHHVLLTRCS
ncbi:hypothetical protein EV182_000079 [Spiromyces aspiralis]|uniref:Uncharacterized protein n=1 Tax=Spiromyces aspiralis TaxID=68401 RepID=A0ACC1HHB6_9FUNG|nr:hypothetical protein EV182_000079 [Spiromyces aspiralis]